jgi:type II secretory pathway predicted ATPase ExeA
VLRRLDDGLGAREPFLLVTGGPGTGKTALAHEAVARWGPRVTAAFVAYAALTGAEFLEEVVRRFGAEPADGASRSKLVSCIERALAEIADRGQVAMLVVDDAHALSLELLEELRLLVNAAQQLRRPFEVLLVGLPALEERLAEPALTALRQRVSVHAKLEPLSPSETRRYLHHRVTAAGGDGPTLFSRKTCRDIAARTGGVPRQINALAAEALRVANAWGDQTVGIEHVQTAAAALGGFAPAADPEVADDASSEASTPAETQAPASTPAPAPAAPERAVTPAPVPMPHKPEAVAPAPAPAPQKPVAVTPAPVPAPPKPQAVEPTIPAPALAPATPAVSAAPPAAATAPTRAAPPIAAPVAPSVSTASTVPAISEPDPQPTITPPLTHDAREWVARFLGDQGPVQLSSRAIRGPHWESEWRADEEAESQGAVETPPPLARANRAESLPGSGPRGVPRVAITAALAAIVVAAAIALVIRVGVQGRKSAGQAAAVTTNALTPLPGNKSSSGGNKDSSSEHRAGSTREAESAPARAEGSPLENSIARSRGPYTLDVGGFRDLDRALEERDRMQRLTGFEGWVVTEAPGEDKPYRVVLGIYRSRQRATAAANMLLNSRTLHYVSVETLPSKSQRQ